MPITPTFRTKHGQVIPMTWDAVRKEASPSTMSKLASFRWQYVTFLLAEADEYSNGEVVYNITGSTSPTSDIDISVAATAKPRIEVAETATSVSAKTFVRQGLAVASFMRRVRQLHNDRFSTPLDVMLDTNLYGSNVVTTILRLASPTMQCQCVPAAENVKSQLIWAAQRLVEPCQTVPAVRDIVASIPVLARLVKAADVGIRPTRLDDRAHEEALLMYYRSVRSFLKAQNANSADDMYTAFSALTMFEQDSYRTIGSTLHVVANRADALGPLGLTCSVLDNLSMAVHILVVGHRHDDPVDDLAPKMAKYVERMCDALKWRDKSTEFDELKRLSRVLNNQRKALDVRPRALSSFLSRLHVATPKTNASLACALILAFGPAARVR